MGITDSGEEPLFLEKVDWGFYPEYLSSDRSRLASWYDYTTDADYIGLIYFDEDGYEHTIYEYDLKRFKLLAAFLEEEDWDEDDDYIDDDYDPDCLILDDELCGEDPEWE